MLKSINFFIVVVAIVVLRLIGMAYVPLTDTSEPVTLKLPVSW